MKQYPVLNTQVIGQAESALGAILDPILAQTGVSFPEWLVLAVSASSGGSAEREQLISRITDARKIEDTVVLAAVTDLAEAGLVTEDSGRVALTSTGQTRYQDVRARIADVTARLFADLAADDLQTAGRVLAIITERANAVLAGSPS